MTTGIFRNEPEAVYFTKRLDEASNSGLKIIGEKSGMHYFHAMTQPDDDESTAAQLFGRAYHKATLEPHDFERLYCVLPSDAPPRPTAAMLKAANPSPSSLQRQDWWANWTATNGNRICLPAATYDAARGMADVMRAHVLEIPTNNGVITIPGGELFDACEKEVTLRWVDPRTKIQCKARLDLMSEALAFAGDLKSCEDASDDGFARACARYRYHQQDAHYLDGMHHNGLEGLNFLFFASEKKKPYAPNVFEMPEVARERGRQLRDHALDRLRRCLDSNTWPSYSRTIQPVMLPAYAFYDATTD